MKSSFEQRRFYHETCAGIQKDTSCTKYTIQCPDGGGLVIGGGFGGTHSNPEIVLETEGVSTANYPCVADSCSVQVATNIPGATYVGGLIGTGLY